MNTILILTAEDGSVLGFSVLDENREPISEFTGLDAAGFAAYLNSTGSQAEVHG